MSTRSGRRMAWRDQDVYEQFQARMEVPMLLLALAFLVVFIGRELFQLSPTIDGWMRAAELGIWALFGAELVALLWTAPHKRRALRVHWLDVVIVTAPFLRVLRIGRILRVVRASSILGRAGTAIHDVTARRGFRGFLLGAAVLIAALGTLTWGFERQHDDSLITTLPEGLWWALVTSTTVGYGDLFPVSPEGRVVAGVLMIVGIAMFSVITAAVAAYFVERDTEQDLQERLDTLEAKLDQVLQQVR
ncbi:MAG TPA: ion channel [Euzebya sp.]|nr:ion channel [Euzebya sp.]